MQVTHTAPASRLLRCVRVRIPIYTTGRKSTKKNKERKPKMANTQVQLKYSVPSENGNFIRVIFESFAKSIFTKNIYGGADIAAKIAYKGIEDYGNYKKPDAHLLTAVDPATNEALGYARWGIPVEHGIESGSPKLSEEEVEKFENAEKLRPDGIRKDWEQMARNLIFEKRNEYMKEGDISTLCCLLESMNCESLLTCETQLLNRSASIRSTSVKGSGPNC